MNRSHGCALVLTALVMTCASGCGSKADHGDPKAIVSPAPPPKRPPGVPAPSGPSPNGSTPMDRAIRQRPASKTPPP